MKKKKKNLGVAKSTSTMEQSLHADVEGRVHLHWKVDLRSAVDLKSKSLLPSMAFYQTCGDSGMSRAWQQGA